MVHDDNGHQRPDCDHLPYQITRNLSKLLPFYHQALQIAGTWIRSNAVLLFILRLHNLLHVRVQKSPFLLFLHSSLSHCITGPDDLVVQCSQFRSLSRDLLSRPDEHSIRPQYFLGWYFLPLVRSIYSNLICVLRICSYCDKKTQKICSSHVFYALLSLFQ